MSSLLHCVKYILPPDRCLPLSSVCSTTKHTASRMTCGESIRTARVVCPPSCMCIRTCMAQELAAEKESLMNRGIRSRQRSGSKRVPNHEPLLRKLYLSSFSAFHVTFSKEDTADSPYWLCYDRKNDEQHLERIQKTLWSMRSISLILAMQERRPTRDNLPRDTYGGFPPHSRHPIQTTKL